MHFKRNCYEELRTSCATDLRAVIRRHVAIVGPTKKAPIAAHTNPDGVASSDGVNPCSRTSSLIHRVHVSRLRLVVFPTTSAPFMVRFFGYLLIRFLRHRTSSRRRSDGSWPRAIPICAPLEGDHVAVTTGLDPRSETTLPDV